MRDGPLITLERSFTKERSRTLRPVGKCIYCGDDAGPLTREHVIPIGLGGGLILPKASCDKHRAITSNFETKCQRGMMLPYRMAFSLMRHQHEAPKTRVIHVGEDKLPVEVPFTEGPVHLLLPEFLDRAGILARKVFSGPPRHKMRLLTSETGLREQARKLGSNTLSVDVPFDMGAHLRLIAKIAHGLIVADIGLENFSPYLIGLIDGDQTYMAAHFIGAPEWEPRPSQSKTFHHQLGWRLFDDGSLVAQIRLFAIRGGPAVSVVVGRTDLSQDDVRQLAPY